MYALNKEITHLSFDETYKKVIDALKKQGFGVLTEIDVKDTMKKKLSIDFDRYVILGACNPPFAHKILEYDRNAGLLLPCNVCIWEKGNKVVISAINPVALFETLINDDEVEPIAKEVKRRIDEVIDSI
ncbi:MAG: DUF302 domain-containing protein [Candidatus Thorarchaeota archaeon]